LDAVSWHEFGIPARLQEHVAEIKSYMSANPKLCNPYCPEIHINEYAAPKSHLIPEKEFCGSIILKKPE
jgi:hypothetical protein